MPDLGQYADTVLAAYAISAVLFAALGLATWRQSRQARKALKDAETLFKAADDPT
ncbi:MAG: heme exporter protein CcmD [Pseudomonadota bacterium]